MYPFFTYITVSAHFDLSLNDPQKAKNQDLVVVSVNYRLGPWGFFYLNEKESDQEYKGNWGLLDQQAGINSN